jgi:DNA polymerase III alpha subunit (gram-positive type)
LQRNNIDQWESLWSSLFQDLFKPTKYLETIIRSIPFPENSYIAVHIRFVNAIEIIEPAYKRSTLLSELEQNALIEACFNKISEISLSKKKPVVIFSDSNRFLSEARKLGYCVISGNVGHIKYSHSQDVIDKTFLDLYALARAESIFSIVGENLYQSVFPLYGALINNKQFHRVNI